MTEDITLLKKELVRDRNLGIGLGTALIISGVIILMVTTYNKAESSWFTAVLSIAMTTVGTGMLGLGFIRHDVNKHELIKTLTEESEKVVWVYYMKVESMPYGVRIMNMTTLFFLTVEGEKHSIRAHEKQIVKLLELLRNRLPHASFGYSREKDQLYRANPNLLRR